MSAWTAASGPRPSESLPLAGSVNRIPWVPPGVTEVRFFPLPSLGGLAQRRPGPLAPHLLAFE
eukprot:15820147-Heterocapsa_arctica.AAC.1